jgi:hypothetical protein
MECEYCGYKWMDDRSPEMCSNKILIAKFGRINYCETYNPVNKCQEGQINLRGLLKRLFKK